MFTLRNEDIVRIGQIKRMKMNAGAEGRVWRSGNKVREWHSGVDCTANIPGSNPDLPLTFIVTLGKLLNFRASISLSLFCF